LNLRRSGVSRAVEPTKTEEIDMAELTNLESKLAEVLGLAMAAQGATRKVRSMEGADPFVRKLDQMHDEAAETEERCTRLASELDGKKTAILEKAREVKGEATEMMETYLAGEEEALDGFEFLTMAEAGEVGHWSIVGKLNERAGDTQVGELVDWALPIQKRHFQDVMDASLQLAAEEDPDEPAE
jgi:hypothetical protein